MGKVTKKTGFEKELAELRQTMLDDLTARGMVEPVYIDKVDEYIVLKRHLKAAQDDIAERGVVYVNEMSGRVEENPAGRAERDYSRCMLNIFKALGLHKNATSAPAPVEDDEL